MNAIAWLVSRPLQAAAIIGFGLGFVYPMSNALGVIVAGKEWDGRTNVFVATLFGLSGCLCAIPESVGEKLATGGVLLLSMLVGVAFGFGVGYCLVEAHIQFLNFRSRAAARDKRGHEDGHGGRDGGRDDGRGHGGWK